jgi:hypothetical protein
VEAMLNGDGNWQSPFHVVDDKSMFQVAIQPFLLYGIAGSSVISTGLKACAEQGEQRFSFTSQTTRRNSVDCNRYRVGKSNVSTHSCKNPGPFGILLYLHARQKLRKLGDEFGNKMTDAQSNTLSAKKSELWRKISIHEQDRSVFMRDMGCPDHPERRKVPNAEPEHTELGLPSSYLKSSLEESGLASLGDLERSLRQGFCDQALQTLRDLLGARAAELKFKNKNLRGKVASTRAEVKLREQTNHLKVIQWRYNNSRAALLRLGLEDQDLKRYRQVTTDDLKYLRSYLEDESGKLGEGYREIPWLWRSSVAPNDERWQTEGMFYFVCCSCFVQMICDCSAQS